MLRSDLPSGYNAVEILERNLAARGGKVALLSPTRELTYGALSEEVNRLGNALLRLDVRRDERIAILCPDSAEWVVAYFATLKIGAVAVSLNTLLVTEDYRKQLRDCRARVLFVHESLASKLDGLSTLPEFPELVIVIGGPQDRYRALIAEASPALAAAATHRDDIACINYSSGTTSEPKGIAHAHADLALTAKLVGENVLGLRENDRTYAVARLFFTYGTGGNLIFPFAVGASIVLSPESPRDPRVVLRIVEEYRPTVLFNVPTGYASLLGTEGFPKRYDLGSLRLCVSAGEALPARLWESFLENTGLGIIDGIGSTENYHIFICNRPGDIRPGSSGKPVDGYEAKIVDELGQPAKRGEIGDLLIRGPTAALSYRNKFDLSRKTFVGEWLRTGDRYRVDADGYYWHMGRSDDMLKVGGMWVSPLEVENALLGHAAILHCAVVAHQDTAELIKPKAFVVLKEGHAPSAKLAEEILQFAAQQIAPYKRPRWVEFVKALPTTATGKVQRFRLRQGLAADA